ncbi:type 1 glutamine amidotransferase domain-containing protein [Novosphingobium sp. AP12]|uniref:type 1 glutamine amidotransferase domain-containing protein n=1 Tax=Novosphingobium sp. AP12 TaxID=1144305 RepID=UPI000271FB79|nr:type 1 glutamine amidotransferase domain-containing protein [Novosphingobium sp. AP12]EJL24284.1 putative intracellular protease/amidase [Novosphingobium sp. AP12]
MSKGTVLIVGSNATRLGLKGGKTAATGQYLNETVVPAMALVEAGYAIVLATPNGQKPHIDEHSDAAEHFGGDEAAWERGREFFAQSEAMNEVRTLRAVLDDGLDTFAGIFVPGGHAPIVDLMKDTDLGEILRHFHAHGKPTALLCHGPIATLAALPHAAEYHKALIAGDAQKIAEFGNGWPYAGYKMTVFSTNEEEIAEANLLHGELHFKMVNALEGAGGVVNWSDTNFAPFVVEDRELITGENPASDKSIAAKFVAALGRQTPAS